MNPIWLAAPVMCYIVEGPDADWTYTSDSIWEALYGAPEDDEGVITATYSYQAAAPIVTNEGVTEVGPLSGIFDPEWDAFMAGELI